jgi:hypothetical protein
MVPRSAGCGCADAPRSRLTHYQASQSGGGLSVAPGNLFPSETSTRWPLGQSQPWQGYARGRSSRADFEARPKRAVRAHDQRDDTPSEQAALRATSRYVAGGSREAAVRASAVLQPRGQAASVGLEVRRWRR